MNRIKNYDEYKEITGLYRKKSKYSNVFFLKAQVQNLIDEKKLYYIVQEENLFLIEKETGFGRLFYYITNEEIHRKIPFSEDMVIEYVYKNEEDQKKTTEIECMKQLGFVLGRSSFRMMLKSGEVFDMGLEPAEQDTVICFAGISDAEKIDHLLRDNFDPLYAYLPDKSRLLEMINEREILAAKVNGEMAGVLCLEFMHGNMQLWQIAIDRKYRGRGLGTWLVNEYHHIYKKLADTFLLWVDAENDAAQKMYRSAGYQKDGRFAKEYVLRIGCDK